MLHWPGIFWKSCTVTSESSSSLILPIGLSQVYTGTVGNVTVSLSRNYQVKLKKPISFSFARTITVTGVYYIMSYSLHDEP